MVHGAQLRTELVFQDDVLATARYLETLGGKTLRAEQRLMLAVLENAIACFQKYVDGRTSRERKLFVEAEAWLMNPSPQNSFFSLENACETVRLNPEYVRGGLREWKRRHRQGVKDAIG